MGIETKPGEFLGPQASARLVSLLADQHAGSGLGEVTTQGQPVGASSDDDDVI